MLVMTDQDRREEATENETSGVATSPVTQANSEARREDLETVVQSAPEAQNETPAAADTTAATAQTATTADDQEADADVDAPATTEAQGTNAAETVEMVTTEDESEQADTAMAAAFAQAAAQADTAETAEAEPAPVLDETTPEADTAAPAELAEVVTTPTLETGEATTPEPVEDSEAETTEDTGAEAPGASFTPVEEEDDGVRPRRLKDLEVGAELEGRVTSIALYGVFVDIGVGRDGLVHISEMSDTRIDSPSDLVQIGDTVNVRVKGLDLDARRISLTMRSPRERNDGRGRSRTKRAEVDRTALSTLKVGDIVEGTITGMAPFGAFADIGVGKDGLIHISELSEGRVEKPEDAVQVGERHTFKLLEVDPEGTRISLSLRRAQRAQKLQQLEVGQILEGTVSGMAPFGAFVDISVGRDGLVHISELSEGRVGKVEDVVKIGDPVTVRVLEVDPQSKRISLTMRLEERTEEAEAPQAAAPQERRRGGGGRSGRSAPDAQPTTETYVAGDEPEEEFTGNATLEDLLTKFGGSNSSKRKDKGRRRHDEEEDEEESEDRTSRRQREAHRRTLQRVSNDE
jgi:predicted RNA-binding protein with RPS1 domain